MPPGTQRDKGGTPDDIPATERARASVVMGLAAYATARGLSQAEILECTGLGLSELLDPEARLPALAVHRLWRELATRFPDEAIALQLAAVAPLTDYGVLLHVMRFAETPRDALRMFARYREVIVEGLQVTLIDGPEEASLRLHHRLDIIDGGHAAELAIALTVRLGRDGFASDFAPTRAEFRHAPHGPTSQYERALGVPARFECPHNSLVFRAAQLDTRVHRGDAHMLRYLHDHLERARERFVNAAAPRELARVRAAAAANAERGDYGAEALARRLGLGLRTLQRRLREHDTTVAALLDELREANARQLISDHRLGVDELAFLLGYSSARALRRACLRWTGKTPSELRATRVE
ncbi:MAG: AraC family transcriptional regulator [Myxococcales bacterium]|nr:AraC family transcriptional regulator [Myxococcales bacterium]MCB9754603.1 AraC family transcriptional regulator [Myxococcales bacterium]